jgi:hypothetical protein
LNVDNNTWRGRNPRNVWRIGPEPLSAVEVDGEMVDHFASFPRALVRRCLLASLSAKGACTVCGAPWTRVVERESTQSQPKWSGADRANGCLAGGGHEGRTGQWSTSASMLGWRPTCGCNVEPGPAMVIDPFAGSGTTGIVADEMGQNAILIDLSPKYARLAEQRIANARARRFLGDDVEKITPIPGQMSMFE